MDLKGDNMAGKFYFAGKLSLNGKKYGKLSLS